MAKEAAGFFQKALATQPRSYLLFMRLGECYRGQNRADLAKQAYEEAYANVEILTPYALYNICYVNQVYLMFRARLLDRDFKPGDESKEVRLFAEQKIPWDQIAFPIIAETLKQYFKDRKDGLFPFYIGDILSKAL